MTPGQRQLTFNIEPRDEAVDRPGGLQVAGEIKLRGALPVSVDLQHGDALIVVVTGIDGEVLAQCNAEISAPPAFLPIEDKDLGLLGYTRSHPAKIGDPI